jgi:hypothetical protein
MFRRVLAHIRRQPVAFVALFFALGGGAMAASSYIRSTDTIPAGDLAGSRYGNPVIAAGKVTNAKLQNSSLTVTAGTGLSGGGSVSLGGSTTLGIANGGVGTTQLASGSVTNSKLQNSSLSVNPGTGLTGGGSISLGGLGTLSLSPPFALPQNCGAGQVAKFDGTSAWDCATDQNSGGTVTSVGSGTGLTGGPITGSGTLSVDPTVVQNRVSGTCSGGTAIQTIGQDGSVGCSSAPVITSQNYAINAQVVFSAVQHCPSASYMAISGGVSYAGTGQDTNLWQTLDSYPAGNVWIERIDNADSVQQTFTVYAVCVPTA